MHLAFNTMSLIYAYSYNCIWHSTQCPYFTLTLTNEASIQNNVLNLHLHLQMRLAFKRQARSCRASEKRLGESQKRKMVRHLQYQPVWKEFPRWAAYWQTGLHSVYSPDHNWACEHWFCPVHSAQLLERKKAVWTNVYCSGWMSVIPIKAPQLCAWQKNKLNNSLWASWQKTTMDQWKEKRKKERETEKERERERQRGFRQVLDQF